MKFRGQIVDINLVQLLSKTINTFSRQTKELTLRFTKSHLYLISNAESGLDAMRLWSEIPTDFLFVNYAMEGVSAEHDQIYMNLTADALACTLRMINQQSKSVKIKLTQKSCLQVTIEQAKIGRSNIDVVYDIPVRIVSRKFWEAYEEITLPAADVTFYLPRSIYLRHMLEKSKGLSRGVEFKVEAGALKVRLNNLSSEVETIFSGVDIVEASADELQGEISVDAKRLAGFFSCLHIPSTVQILAKLVNQQLLHLSFVQEQILVYFVLPNLID